MYHELCKPITFHVTQNPTSILLNHYSYITFEYFILFYFCNIILSQQEVTLQVIIGNTSGYIEWSSYIQQQSTFIFEYIFQEIPQSTYKENTHFTFIQISCTEYFYKQLYIFFKCPWAYCNWLYLYTLYIHFEWEKKKKEKKGRGETSYLMVLSLCMHSCTCIMTW